MNDTNEQTLPVNGAVSDSLVEYFNRAGQRFGEAAIVAGGAVERTFCIGGEQLCLRFAGPSLAPILTPALEHLAAPPTRKPDLTICVWDAAATGINPPAAPQSEGSLAAAVVPDGEGSRRIFSAVDQDAGVLDLFDPETRSAICCIRDVGQLPPWQRSQPFRGVLGWWAARGGFPLVHGAAVGLEEGGLLLAAPGGSGKSTTALACLKAGWLYAGDDFVLLRDEGELAVYSVYNSAKMHHAHLGRTFPELVRQTIAIDVKAFDYDKSILLLGESHRGQLRSRLSMRAIVVPRVSSIGKTSFYPLSAAGVLRALAPTSIFTSPHADAATQRADGAAALRAMSRLVQRVPGYSLDLGPDLDEVVAVLGRLVRAGGATHVS